MERVKNRQKWWSVCAAVAESLEPRTFLSVEPLDASFGSVGTVYRSMPGSANDRSNALAVNADGSYILVGRTRPVVGNFSGALAKMRADGTLDPSFGTGGLVSAANIPELTSVAILPDGRILASGGTKVFRLSETGVVDPTFGTAGAATLSFTAVGMTLAMDGSIFVTGQSAGAVAVSKLLATGLPDVSFDGDGVVTTDLTTGNDVGNAIAVQADGKVVVFGSANQVLTNEPNDQVFVRYLTTGALDTAFGTGGSTLVHFGGSGQQGLAVAIGGDGRIVGSGLEATRHGTVAVLNAAGKFDNTFSGDGKLSITTLADNFTTVGVMPDGRIVVGGRARTSSSASDSYIVRRFDAAGNPDLTFNSTGISAPTNFGSATTDSVRNLIVLPDGKVAAVGLSGEADFGIVRWTDSGALDTSFNGTGRQKVDFPGETESEGRAVAIQVDGKILVTAATQLRFPVVRYNVDGTLDAAFGTNGLAYLDTPGTGSDTPRAIAVTPAGKILVAGKDQTQFAMVQYQTDGTLDPTFGTNGSVLTKVSASTSGGSDNSIRAVAIQSDGKILAAGLYANIWALVRYNVDGTLDSTFGTGGVANFTVFQTGGPGINDLVVRPDGRIIVVGVSSNNSYNASLWTAVQFNPDGTLDTTFGGGDGRTEFVAADRNSGGFVVGAYAISVLPDGRFIVGGNFQPGYFALVRFLPDGSTDTTFGTGGRLETSSVTNTVTSFKTLSNGTIVASGAISPNRTLMAAYTQDGALVRSFGTNGIMVTGTSGTAIAATVDSSNRIVVAGKNGLLLATKRYLTTPTYSFAATTDATEVSLPGYSIIGKFTLVRGGDLTVPLTVQYSVSGTATPGVDYQALPGNVTFPAGAESVTIDVAGIDDYLLEVPETVTITLAAVPGYTLLTSTTATISIVDNEGPDRYEVNETLPTARVLSAVTDESYPLLSLHNGSDVDVFAAAFPSRDAAIELSFSNALGDLSLEVFDITGARVGFSNGTTDLERVVLQAPAAGTYYIRISAAQGNLTGNPDYTLRLRTQRAFSGTSFKVAVGQVTTVEASAYDEGGPGVAYADATPEQSGKPNALGVKYRSVEQVDVSTATDNATRYVDDTAVGEYIEYSLNVPATAQFRVDFLVANPVVGGTFRLSAGSTDLTGEIAVPGTGGAETFVNVSRIITLAAGQYPVRLTMVSPPAGGGTVGRFASFTFTPLIQTASASSGDPIAAEAGGSDSGAVRISRVGVADQPLIVQYTVTGTATAGTDYEALSGVVTIPSGDTEIWVPIRPLVDSVTEAAETVIVTIASSPAYRIGTSSATTTIYDGASVDRFEPNETIATAAFPAATPVSESGLSLHAGGNVDFYRLRTPTTAGTTVRARIDFDNTQGDLTAIAYSVAGTIQTEVARSATTNNFEEVSFVTDPTVTYYLSVVGATPTTKSPYYTLTVDQFTPLPPSPPPADPVSPPAAWARVRRDGFTLADGQAGVVDLGKVTLDLAGNIVPGSSGSGLANFTVANDGTATLMLGTLLLPVGFTVVVAPPASLVPGASADFVVGIDLTTPPGHRSGSLRLPTNDPARSVFDFRLIGTVITPAATIAGVVYQDIASSALPNNANLAGVSVYLDMDSSGTFTIGEPSTLTASDGSYSISGLTAATIYHVRFTPPPGFIITSPPSGLTDITAVAGSNVANFGIFTNTFTLAGDYTIRLDSSGVNLQILLGGVLQSSIPKNLIPTLNFSSVSSGADSLTIDLSAGDTIPTSGVSFDGGTGANTLAVLGSATADTFSLSASSLTVNGKAVAFASGTTAINVAGGVGNDALTITAATTAAIRFDGGLTATDQDLLTINAGTYKLQADPSAASAHLSVVDNATLDLNGIAVTIAALTGTGTVTNTSTTPATLSVAGGSTLAGVTNGAGTFGGIIGSGTGGVSVAKTGTGTFTLTGVNTYTGSTTVTGGTLDASGGAIDSSVGAMSVANTGSILIAKRIAPSSLNIGTGATVQLTSTDHGGDLTGRSTAGTLVNSGLLDVGGTGIIVASVADSSAIRAQIIAGRGSAGGVSGAWTGTSGITSSVARTDGANRAVGYVVNGAQVIIAQTLMGDSTLDGRVNVLDRAAYLSNAGGSGKSWQEADFNFDGFCNVLDRGAYLSHAGQSLP